MKNLDYNAEMLRQYFKEQDFSKEKIYHLLENNPFDRNYVIWEKQTINNNRKFANFLKTRKMITEQDFICEIGNHEDNSVTMYLVNPKEYHVCPDNGKINFNYNNILLIKDLLHGEDKLLKRLDLKRVPTIMGVCTKNERYYQRCKSFYEELVKEYGLIKIIDETTKQKIYIARTKN